MLEQWNYQITASDCGLCAISNALLHKGIEFNYDIGIELIQKRGLEWFEYSGFFFTCL